MKTTNTFLICICLLFITIFSDAQTYVSGGIYVNTTWTSAGSPYVVTDTLTLFQGVTLIINPGVEIQFDDNVPFDVRGTISAIGTITDSISFTSSSPIPNQFSWPGITLHTELNATIAFSFCHIQYAISAVFIYFNSAPPPSSIIQSTIENNFAGIEGYAGTNFLTVNQCTFKGNTYGIGNCCGGTAHLTPSHCIFSGNLIGISMTEDVNPIGCTFCVNNKGLSARWCIIDSCVIRDNNIGFNEPYDNGYYEVNNSTIAYNDTGIVLHSGSTSTDIFSNVNICSNYSFNVVHRGIYNFNMSGLCWCESDSLILSQKIYDGYDNVNYGLITFLPTINCGTSVLEGLASCAPEVTDIKTQYISGITLKNYPNPFSNYTTIEFSVRNIEFVTIILYDLNGREIKTLITNQVFGIGNNSYYFDSSKIPTGIYYCQLKCDDKIETSRMALIR